MTSKAQLTTRQKAPLATPSDIDPESVMNITGGLNAFLADVFALYLKTKNFHWHMSGPHFRDYHLLLDEHADQIFAMTDEVAERVRKLGGTTIHSIGQICRLQRLADNDADYVTPADMLSELHEDEKRLVQIMRALHILCDDTKASHRGYYCCSCADRSLVCLPARKAIYQQAGERGRTRANPGCSHTDLYRPIYR
jgi:starvation-inducible DNA-binding protein